MKKTHTFRAVWVILIILLLLGQTAWADGGTAENGEVTDMRKNAEQYGLHVEADGTLTLEGQPFYGFGLNLFGAFAHSYADDSAAYETAFDALEERGIPFVRLPLCGYYPDYYACFDENPDAMLDKMQALLDSAAAHRIGVIATLMWWDPAVALHVNGKRADMGQADSDVTRYARWYTETVVARFADHPAVWGWEIGNEYNLDADLCDADLKEYLWDMRYPGTERSEPDGRDYYTGAEMAQFYTEIAAAIRKYDDYRMISSGNSEMRTSAYALYNASQRASDAHLWNVTWHTDTQEKFDRINAIYTPDPVDTVSFHLQHGTQGSEEPAYVLSLERFRTTIDTADYFRAYAETARAQKKALFLGEFGDLIDMEQAPDAIDVFRQVTDWITEAGIQLAASWQFQDYTEEGINGQKLDVLSECNRRLRAEGRQDTSGAWQPRPTEEAQSTTDRRLIAGLVCCGAAVVSGAYIVGRRIRKKKNGSTR